MQSQYLVFEELIEILEFVQAIEDGVEELELGDATDIAIAISRAQRLSRHLGSEHPTTLAYASQLDEALNMFKKHKKWSEEVIKETNFTEIVNEFCEALADPEITERELIRSFIEVDRLLSALEFIEEEEETLFDLSKKVSVAVTTELEGAAKLSKQVQNFINEQAPKLRWGKICEEIADAQNRLKEFKELEAELNAYYAVNPLPRINFFAGLEGED